MPLARIVVAGLVHCGTGRVGSASFPTDADGGGATCGMPGRVPRGRRLLLHPIDVALVLALLVDAVLAVNDDLDVGDPGGSWPGNVCTGRLGACVSKSAGPNERPVAHRLSLPNLARRRAASRRPDRPSQKEPTEEEPSMEVRRATVPQLLFSVAPIPAEVLGKTAVDAGELPLLGVATELE